MQHDVFAGGKALVRVKIIIFSRSILKTELKPGGKCKNMSAGFGPSVDVYVWVMRARVCDGVPVRLLVLVRGHACLRVGIKRYFGGR